MAKNVSFAKSLDLNGAVRATKYSISGYVRVGLRFKM